MDAHLAAEVRCPPEPQAGVPSCLAVPRDGHKRHPMLAVGQEPADAEGAVRAQGQGPPPGRDEGVGLGVAVDDDLDVHGEAEGPSMGVRGVRMDERAAGGAWRRGGRVMGHGP